MIHSCVQLIILNKTLKTYLTNVEDLKPVNNKIEKLITIMLNYFYLSTLSVQQQTLI